MDTKRYHIAQFGTFDVESMGDSVFPKGLQFGMNKFVSCDTELFSMNECEKPYNHNGHVYSFQQFAQRHALRPFDLVVLGGGEFLHFNAIRFTVDGEEKPYAGGYLWKEPIRMAKEHKIPVVINCAGAPHDFTTLQQEELREIMKDISCVAVRDEFSAKRLVSAGVDNVRCVADNLWYMNAMYPKAELDALRYELERKTYRDFTTPYIVVQYGTTRDVRTLAGQLLEIKKATGYRICLMPMNYCHEDRLGMRKLHEASGGAFEEITNYFIPREMMAVISGAKAFIGTSLHGNLTAASYGVPFVAIDMYPSLVSKMDGILTMIGCEDYLAPDEGAVKAALDARFADQNRESEINAHIADIQQKLDLHFQQMAQILKGAC